MNTTEIVDAAPPVCVCELTIKFLSERVGSIQQDVGFRVNRLQFFQSGLPPTDTLHTHTHTEEYNSHIQSTTVRDVGRRDISALSVPHTAL